MGIIRANKKSIFCFGGAVIGLVFIIIVISLIFSPQNRFLSQLKNENFEKAEEIYSGCDSEKQEKIEEIVSKYFYDVIDGYNAGKIDYEKMNKITSFATEITDSSEMMETMKKLHDSKEVFDKAEEYLKNGDWSKAKIEYKKVIEDDENYSKAKDGIEKCDKEISIAAFNLGQQYQSEGKWAEALAEYQKVSEITPDEYKKGEEQKKVCIDNFKSSVNAQLDELFVAGQYEEGLKLIELAEKYMSGDEALKAHKENFTTKKEEADKIKEQNKYNTGITYDQLSRNPDDYKGKYVKFYGKVLQVQSGSGYTVYRIGTGGYGYYDNVIYVIQMSGNTSDRVIEDDYVTIRGVSSGLYTYTTVMGNEITIPSIVVDYIDR